jgi:hypothetical protein
VKAVAERIRKVANTPVISLFSRGMSIPTHAHVVVYPSTGEGPLERIMTAFSALAVLRQITPSQLDEMASRIRLA